jgi:hypothetical protein
MDLLSTIRKEGSRGGVDFKWSDVSTSTHRENYLGHSLMAPVGRWQKGRDLNWYAKAGDLPASSTGETEEEKKTRLRKEEIRLIKEAEEDALARALGLPVKDRGATGVNAIPVMGRDEEIGKMVKEAEGEEGGGEEVGEERGRFAEYLGANPGEQNDVLLGDEMEGKGGLVGGSGRRKEEKPRERRENGRGRRERHRHHHSHHHRDQSRSRSREHRRHRDDESSHRDQRHRSRSPNRRDERPQERRDSRERRRSRERRGSRERRPSLDRIPRNRSRDRHREERRRDRER